MATGAIFVLFIAAASVGMGLPLMSAAELPLARQTTRVCFSPCLTFKNGTRDLLERRRRLGSEVTSCVIASDRTLIRHAN